MRPFPDPSILLHPQIPKPLHLLNPRTILGKGWWDKVRKEAYWRHGFRCHACSIPGDEAKYRAGLEGHEMFDIDYVSGKVEFIEVVALCYSCHNYIHKGRLSYLLDAGKISGELFSYVLTRGNEILSLAGLPFDANAQLLTLLRDNNLLAGWKDYRMIINGVDHGQRFRSQEEWAEYWANQQQGVPGE